MTSWRCAFHSATTAEYFGAIFPRVICGRCVGGVVVLLLAFVALLVGVCTKALTVALSTCCHRTLCLVFRTLPAGRKRVVSVAAVDTDRSPRQLAHNGLRDGLVSSTNGRVRAVRMRQKRAGSMRFFSEDR